MEIMLTKSIKKITTWVIGICLLALLAFPSNAYACACCADAGQWSQASRKIADSEFKEINSLQFAPNPKLFFNASGDDGIRGISPISSSYTLSVTKKQRNWNLLFKDGSGKTGNLNFTIPQSMVDFRTHFFGNQEGGGGGPVLYKEFRLEGKVTGNGIFSRGITSDAKYRLVLQGKGGNCTVGSEFKSWNLQVFGSRARFSFYGLFK
jgi:hypothetical protein